MADEVIDSSTSGWTASVVGLVIICTLLSNFLQRFNNAYWFSTDSILAIIVGFVASLPLCSETVAHPHASKEFDTVFFLYLIPPILFDSGYSLNQRDFFHNFTAIVLLAVVGTIVSSIVTGISLFHLASSGHMIGINATSPKEGLLVGSLLSATDPVATLAVLGSLNVDPQLYNLVFGESVLNDAVAIVLYQTFEELPDQSKFHVSAGEGFSALFNFMGVGFGSIGFGVLFGIAASIMTKNVMNKASTSAEVTIMLSMPYLGFIAADAAGLSGLMAVFFCGVVMSHYAKYNLSEDGRHTTHNVSHTLGHIGELLTFLYFGFTILPMIAPSCSIAEDAEEIFMVNWPFVGWTLLLCLVSRAANVVPLTLFLNYCVKARKPEQRINLRSCFMIWFSGLRGAIAFALSLTMRTANRRFIIPCVVMIVLFTNIVLGSLTAPVLKLLQIPTHVPSNPDDDEVDSPDGPRKPSRKRGKMHQLWRQIDDKYIKPIAGGRSRSAYTMQRDDDQSETASVLEPLDADRDMNAYPMTNMPGIAIQGEEDDGLQEHSARQTYPWTKLPNAGPSATFVQEDAAVGNGQER